MQFIGGRAKNGESPLYVACERSHIKVVQLILAQFHGFILEASIHDKRDLLVGANHDESTTLHAACREEDPNIAALLIREFSALCPRAEQRFEFLQARTKEQGVTPLFVACFKNRVCVFQLLIACMDGLTLPQKLEFLKAKRTDGKTALHMACKEPDLSIANIISQQYVLLSKEMKDAEVFDLITEKAILAETALFQACEDDNLSAVILLIDLFKLAIPNATHEQKLTFLTAANHNNVTAFEMACRMRHADIATFLVEQFSQLGNAVIVSQQTILMRALNYSYGAYTRYSSSGSTPTIFVDMWEPFQCLMSQPAVVDHYISTYNMAFKCAYLTKDQIAEERKIGAAMVQRISGWMIAFGTGSSIDAQRENNHLLPLAEYFRNWNSTHRLLGLFRKTTPGYDRYVVANFVIEQHKNMQAGKITKEVFIQYMNKLLSNPHLRSCFKDKTGTLENALVQIIRNVNGPVSRQAEYKSPALNKRVWVS